MQPKIVIIEDEPSRTELTAAFLQSHGMSVITTYNTRDALRSIRETQPTVILLEPSHTDMDGFQICHVIREISNAPILILSALNDPMTIANALDNGADDYLVKPVAGEVLLARLSRLIKRTACLVPATGAATRPWLPRQLSP